MKKIFLNLIICTTIISISLQCQKESIGLISGKQEIELGRKIDSIIINSQEEYPILDTPQYKNAYAYLDTITKEILKSNFISRKTAFNYKIRIIRKENLHAFAVPGGYLYFNTGMINYLNNGAQFAGLMAHQIAHIDRRHITQNLEQKYHIDQLIEVIWQNNPALLAEITRRLTLGTNDFKFGSAHEYEADEYAVKYISSTDYDSRGIADFFYKLELAASENNIPEFLKEHPNPGKRFETITNIWTELGSPEGSLFEREYNALKLSLIRK